MSSMCTEPRVKSRSLAPSAVNLPKHLQAAQQLSVAREDINFYNVAPDRVRVEITVRNPGLGESAPTSLDLEVADFGAFLPWHPLARLSVPAIAPRGRTIVAIEVDQARLEARTGRPRRRPGEPVTATAGDELQPTDQGNSLGLLEQAVARWQALRSVRRLLRGAGPMSRRSTHWIGNINVFVGRTSVERHLARALRVYPGLINRATFSVGTRTDEYSFACAGLPMERYVSLQATSLGELLPPIQPETWLMLRSYSTVHLSLDLPAECTAGQLAVHVRRRSDQQEAVVEFSLAADAAGPGCYVVGG